MFPPTHVERELSNFLHNLPFRYKFEYSEEVTNELIQFLFRASVNFDDSKLPLLFPNGTPTAPLDYSSRWKLQDAQSLEEGAEYSEAARGHPCGHIFKTGEASYRCKTCTNDDTCALCARCFESSDHEGHAVYVSISPGNSGCCDCGDDEAWNRPLVCSIHTIVPGREPAVDPKKTTGPAKIPAEIKRTIRDTICQVLDYICDVFSCAPEHVKTATQEAAILENVRQSRLKPWFARDSSPDPDRQECDSLPVHYGLAVWHDEKHTVPDVENQIARACRITHSCAKKYTHSIEDVGRYVVYSSPDLQEVLKKVKIIESIGLTVTVRSVVDIFREEMCASIIEWLHDIVGCTVGNDVDILRNTVCNALLSAWRHGSPAHNLIVGKDGIQDNTRPMKSIFDHLASHITPAETGLVAGLLDEIEAEGMAEDEDDRPIDDPDMDDADYDDEDEPVVRHPFPEFMFLRAPGRNEGRSEVRPMDIAPGAQHPIGSREGPFLIPKTPVPIHQTPATSPPPEFWTAGPATTPWRDAPWFEMSGEQLLLDYLILYDIRMWKTMRINLRDILIRTVVTVVPFKRYLGLRFAGLYSVLAQLYLIADREPDLSIINLSLQMLTSPSITREMVDRKYFLSNLLAILYTFMTNRQVGYPKDIDTSALFQLDQGTVTNRRMYHFFIDLKYILASPQIQQAIKEKPHYLMQFLDLVKLVQGIHPSVRAVDEHVEYENELWVTAFTITREMNKICRLWCESYIYSDSDNPKPIHKAIRIASQFAILNSSGCDFDRFQNHEIRSMVGFHRFPRFEFQPVGSADIEVVKFDVASCHLSFHHPLHYALSWIVERAKRLSISDIKELMSFTPEQLIDCMSETVSDPPNLSPEQFLLSMFDLPIRVMAWLAQMKSGMWVRNGVSLRQQMASYCSAPQRELAYNRDLLLIQLAFCLCDPTTVLASVIDRFGFSPWVGGDYTTTDKRGEDRMVECLEDLVHLLIIVVCDRVLLLPPETAPDTTALLLRRDITHSLCFKPLSYSDISSKVPEKFHDTSKFEDVLNDISKFKTPESAMESGVYELKPEMIEEIDPFVAQYTKNQMEEAEKLYKESRSKKTGVPVDQIVLEPTLAPINSGPFAQLSMFVHSPLFAEMIYQLLSFANKHSEIAPSVSSSKVESLINFVLHLILVALREGVEHVKAGKSVPEQPLWTWIFKPRPSSAEFPSIISLIFDLLDSPFNSCHPRAGLILRVLKEGWAEEYSQSYLDLGIDESKASPPGDNTNAEDEKERKKRLARERQARIMARFKESQNAFMMAQDDWDENEGKEDDMESIEEKNLCWEFPADNCIMCQEKTGTEKLYGTFAYISPSTNFRSTDFSDPKWIGEVRDTPTSLDVSAQAIRPFGVAGQNKKMVEKLSNTGEAFIQERQSLSEGFPIEKCSSWGQVVTGCGHVMHYSCYTTYATATRQRHLAQIARLHPERTQLQEFLCPLCKAVGNAFLPILWKEKPLTDSMDFYPESDLGRFWGKLSSQSTDWTCFPEGFSAHIERVSATLGVEKASLISTATPPSSLKPNQDALSEADDLDLYNISDNYHTIEKVYSSQVKNMTPPQLSSPYYNPPKDDQSVLNDSNSDMDFLHLLIQTLAHSITSVEVSQRGVASDTYGTYLDGIPNQMLITLRVISETILTVAVVRRGVYQHISGRQADLINSLLGQESESAPEIKGKYNGTKPLLIQDPFQFLVEASVYLVKFKSLDLHSILQLCYMAEVTRAVIIGIYSILSGVDFHSLESAEKTSGDYGSVHMSGLIEFLFNLAFRNVVRAGKTPMKEQFAEWVPYIQTIVATYSLTFLRKSLALLHIFHGISMTRQSDIDPDADELTRLSSLLNLPTTMGLFFPSTDLVISDVAAEALLAWLNRPQSSQNYNFVYTNLVDSIKMGHPGIFELVGLPRIYDALIEETTKRRCPSTGRKLNDPAICLFCGDIFCGQATCCTVESQGGCSRHVAKCGRTIGMFLNIRKCMVILLNGKTGSYFVAPYLDKHSEADSMLRRQQQLFLNQHRYDVLLRSVWLNHGIPSTIARKLENEMNTGGWETL